MKQIATLTVVRGTGGCEAIMNGIVQEEIKRQQAAFHNAYTADAHRATAAVQHRDRLLADRLAALNHKLNGHNTLLQRLWRPVANAWAMFWAVWFNLGEIVLNWGVTHGMWEVIDDGCAG